MIVTWNYTHSTDITLFRVICKVKYRYTLKMLFGRKHNNTSQGKLIYIEIKQLLYTH